MLTGFDDATAVTPAGEGVYTVAIDEAWTVGDKPNGGYLLAMLGRAAVEAVAAVAGDDGAHPDPLAVSAHYLSAPDVGEATVTTEVLRVGRRASQVRARLSQGDRPCVESVVTLGALAAGTHPWWSASPPPGLAPRADCIRLPARREGAEFSVPVMDRVELRLDPADMGFATGRPSGSGSISGWVELPDGQEMTPTALLFVVDAMPPASFELASTGWVPTLELTAYLRARPVAGPLRVRQRATSVQDGLLDEVCEVWDGRGHLVAQATQLAGIRISDSVAPPTGSPARPGDSEAPAAGTGPGPGSG